MEEMEAVALAALILLVVAHLFAGRLTFLEGTPRSYWLSGAGGISVAYVIVHLLPELSEAQEAVTASAEGGLPFAERHVYLLALVGLALFYGVERSTRRSKGAPGTERKTSGGPFWLAMSSFALYNAVVGYLLLHREEETTTSLVFFAAALTVHFVVNDFALRDRHREAYRRVGRWVLAAAIVAGYVVGQLWEISDAALALLIAFLGGGIIFNVLNEELPEERQARFSAFVLGAGAYAALLLAG